MHPKNKFERELLSEKKEKRKRSRTGTNPKRIAKEEIRKEEADAQILDAFTS